LAELAPLPALEVPALEVPALEVPALEVPALELPASLSPPQPDKAVRPSAPIRHDTNHEIRLDVVMLLPLAHGDARSQKA
jgi:hypothetical protein